MRRLLLATACVLITAMPAFSQTLRIALRQDLDVLDPTLATTYVGRIVFAGLCDKLFDIDEKLKIVPQLATGYEWADDRTLVIHLRSGVKFQNGEVLDAAAVKYSLERHLTMQGSYRKGEINSIDHVDVVDPSTVRIVLKVPSGAFLAQLTDRSGMVLPPKATEAAGKEFASHPVCSGPFKFVERVPQDHVTLERFADYWDAKNVHFDKVVYQVLVDPSVRLANLRAGTIELAEICRGKRCSRGQAGSEAAADPVGCARLLRHQQQCRQRAAGEQSVRPECVGASGAGRRDRSGGAGQCRVQRHVRADRAGRAAQLAIFRRGAEGAATRCGEGEGAAADRPA